MELIKNIISGNKFFQLNNCRTDGATSVTLPFLRYNCIQSYTLKISNHNYFPFDSRTNSLIAYPINLININKVIKIISDNTYQVLDLIIKLIYNGRGNLRTDIIWRNNFRVTDLIAQLIYQIRNNVDSFSWFNPGIIKKNNCINLNLTNPEIDNLRLIKTPIHNKTKLTSEAPQINKKTIYKKQIKTIQVVYETYVYIKNHISFIYKFLIKFNNQLTNFHHNKNQRGKI